MNSASIQIRQGFARNLLLARKAKNMTQSDLAKAAGVSRATVAQIEGEDVDPKLSTLALLAEALDMTPVWLLMTEQDLSILSALSSTAVLSEFSKSIPEETVERMKVLTQSGRCKSVLNAVDEAEGSLPPKTRSELLGEEGRGIKSAPSAISTSLLPGTGTLLGSIWDRVMSSPARSAADAIQEMIGDVSPDSIEEAIQRALYTSSMETRDNRLHVTAFITALYVNHDVHRSAVVGGSLLKRFGSDAFPSINERELWYAQPVDPEVEEKIYKQLDDKVDEAASPHHCASVAHQIFDSWDKT